MIITKILNDLKYKNVTVSTNKITVVGVIIIIIIIN